MLSTVFALALLTAPTPKPASNTLCPVLGNPVNASSKVVVVKDQQYRICCPGCEADLKGNPAKFLKADGTPKNAK
jgi:hypothetical protein